MNYMLFELHGIKTHCLSSASQAKHHRSDTFGFKHSVCESGFASANPSLRCSVSINNVFIMVLLFPAFLYSII